VSTNRTANTIFSNSDTIARWLNRSIEGLWLLTVVLVPLAFLDRSLIYSEAVIAFVEVPKIALLRTLVGLMTVLWLIEWGLRGHFPFITAFGNNRETGFEPSAYVARLHSWLSERPTRWLVLAVWFFAITTLISTLLSASFNVSLWGEVPGQDGLSTYTVATYLLLFGLITTHLKTRSQLWRLLSAVVAMGVVVAGFAVLQHYGHDLLNALEGSGGGQNRVTSTVGNAVFAGALMLIPIAVSLMLATISMEKVSAAGQRKSRWWTSMSRLMIINFWALILTIQFLGIVFTFSRGPWLGTILALLVFLLLSIMMVGWRAFGGASLILGLAALLTWAALQSFETGTAPSNQLKDAQVFDITERFASVSSEVRSGGFSNRADIWNGSLTLMRDHPWFEFDDLSLPWLRLLVGYGPDMFRYTYLLVSVPMDTRLLPAEPDHAHSFIVNQGVEQGILGLLSAAGIFLASFGVAGYQVIKRSGSYSDIHKLALIGLFATISGRFLEQFVGVSKVSDLMLFWVILAVFAALPIVMQAQENAEPTPSQEPIPTRTRRDRNSYPPRQLSNLDLQTFLRLAMVAWAVGGIIALTWVKAVSYPRAAIVASQGIEQLNQGNYQASLASLDRASQLAPDVPIYYGGKASIYTAYLQNPQVPPDPECSLELNGVPYRDCLALNIHFNNILGSEQRPFYWRSRMARANSALALGLNDEAIRLYQEVIYLVPTAWPLHNRLAEAYIDIGKPELALKVLDGSLTITGDTYPARQAIILQDTARKALAATKESPPEAKSN
jgi:O-antigen ligase